MKWCLPAESFPTGTSHCKALGGCSALAKAPISIRKEILALEKPPKPPIRLFSRFSSSFSQGMHPMQHAVPVPQAIHRVHHGFKHHACWEMESELQKTSDPVRLRCFLSWALLWDRASALPGRGCASLLPILCSCLLPESELLPFLTSAPTAHACLSPLSVVHLFNIKKGDFLWIITGRPTFTAVIPRVLLGGGGRASCTLFPPRHWKPALLALNDKLLFFFSRQIFASVMYCKSSEMSAKVRASILKVCVGVAMGQRWQRRALGRDAQTLCASLWSPPCREGRAAACALSGLRKIQQIRNPLPVLPVSRHITQKGSFYPASVASFHFSDALDYWRCLIHIYFCHLFLTTFFFFFFFNIWAVWKAAKTNTGTHDLSWPPWHPKPSTQTRQVYGRQWEKKNGTCPR